MKIYRIKIKNIVPFKNLDFDDKNEFSTLAISDSLFYFIKAENEQKALDDFHSTQPISVLENFEITCEEFTE